MVYNYYLNMTLNTIFLVLYTIIIYVCIFYWFYFIFYVFYIWLYFIVFDLYVVYMWMGGVVGMGLFFVVCMCFIL